MKNLKLEQMIGKISIWGGITVIVILATAYYFLILQNTANNNPIELVPNNAAIIIQIDEPEDFFSKFNPENEIWKSLEKSTKVKKSLSQFISLDSIIKSDNDLTSKIPGQIIISLHYDTAFNESHLLYIIEAENPDIKQFQQILNKHFSVSFSQNYPDVLSVYNANLDLTLFMGLKGNVVMLSRQDWLVDRSIEVGKKSTTHFSKSDAFINLSSTAGNNTDAKIYFNYNYLSKLLNPYLLHPSSNQLAAFGNIAEWTETDLLIKNDELLFSGFTVSSKQDELSTFSDQNPANVKSFNVAPNNTNVLFTKNFSDISKIVNADKINTLSKSVNFDLSKLLEECGNELSLVSNASGIGQITNNTWVFVQMSNPKKAEQYLKLISSNTGVKRDYKNGQYRTREIKTRDFVPGIFGQSYSVIENTWYTIIDEFAIFGNSRESLNQLIRHYNSGKTLDLNEDFKEFRDNISGSSNISIYFRPGHLSGVFEYLLSDEAISIIEQYQSVLSDFQGFSLQFSSQDSLFYTNFFTRNNKSLPKENLDIWRIELDNDIAGSPYLVKDHTNNTFNIIVFDIESNIYMITSNGQVAWKKRLDNIPESGIEQVDYFKNGKIQYMFNTRDFVYLIDKNGENVTNFPQKINPSATGGLSLFDYDKDKKYRMMIPQADKRVYNYTESGKKVKGWLKPKSENIVTEPIIHLSANGLDYILITDINNNLQIVNRRGEKRINLKKRPDKARNSTYYVNRTNNKGIILTTDKYGRLTYISNSGKVQYTEFGEYSADHFFLYEDFTGNGGKDFIYIEGNQINVFDRFKKVLFNYKFPSTIEIKPLFFNLGRKQNVLGVVDSKSKTIYLFDKHGKPVISSGLVGENPFIVGSLKDDDEINLITSVGKTLFNYRIK